MTSILPRFEHGPRTYTATEAIDGGQLAAAAAGGIAVADAGATRYEVVGVAQKYAEPGGNDERVADATGLLDVRNIPENTVVYDHGYLKVTYAAAAVHGDALKVAAGGQVTPATVGTDADNLIVAVCAEPDGVALGETGLIRLSL